MPKKKKTEQKLNSLKNNNANSRNDLAVVFREQLLRWGISNSDIIEKTDIPDYTVSRIFSKDPIISMENAVKISKSLNISLNYLFGVIKDNPVIDESIDNICKQTGLSYHSVDNLIHIKNTGDFSWMSALNEIISYESIPLLLADLQEYFNFRREKNTSVIIPLKEFGDESNENYKRMLGKLSDRSYRYLNDSQLENANLESVIDHLRLIKKKIQKAQQEEGR